MSTSVEPFNSFDVRTRPAIRRLIWLYFFLLMFEGALRKWILPGLSNPLLLVREPVVILIYLLALGEGIFVFNGVVTALAGLGGAAIFFSLSVGTSDPLVTTYGFCANFLHLPLIFIIPSVMGRDHVIKLGRWVLVLSVPMAILMVIQFRSPPDAWINCGAGGGVGSQMRSALGKIRPPGLFTFIVGAAQYLAFAVVFLIMGFMEKGVYGRMLLLVSGFALVMSTVVSSSRLVLGGIGVVFLMIGFIVYYDRSGFTGTLRLLLPLGLILVVATNLDVFQEGRAVFEARLQEAGDAKAGLAETASNWTERMFGAYVGGFYWAHNSEILGGGLGVGTNVGVRFLKVSAEMVEGEPARVMIEMGPIVGTLYLLVRQFICVMLFRAAAASARVSNFLPMLLFGSCVLSMSSGQFSQSSILGFSVLGAGVCLAAAPLSDDETVESDGSGDAEIKPRGCGPHAQSLHPAQPGPVPQV